MTSFFAFTSYNAFAYIDPGSGSYLFQLLLAAVFGFFYTIKQNWNALKSKWSKAPKSSEPSAETPPSSTEDTHDG